MKNRIFIAAILLFVTTAATTLRLVDLNARVMHTDEAVHAIKFADLLEDGFYEYDKNEYHGPTLNYCSLVIARVLGLKNTSQVSDAILRSVPAVCGGLLILLILLVINALGSRAAVWTAILTAISGAFVYYSRYYIQEMLLVCFTFGVMACGYRYATAKRPAWAIAAGVFAGLMFATKETCIISWGAMVAAAAGAMLMSRNEGRKPFEKIIKPWHIAAAVLASVIVAALFFSSLLTNWPGVLDSVKAYATYFDRAGGGATHVHPWHFYFRLLTFCHEAPGPVFSEAPVVVLAVVGFVLIFKRKYSKTFNPGFLRFVAFYTAMMAAVYSAMPYKTPWCMLGFYHGMLILAGFGAAGLWRICKGQMSRAFLGVLLLCGILFIGWQSHAVNFVYAADWRNPYVYGHTSPKFMKVVDRIEDIAAVHPDGKNIYIEVVCPEEDYWPLPWYLRVRKFTNVGYFSQVNMDFPPGAIIIALQSDVVQRDIMHKLYEVPPPGKRDMYVPLFDEVVEDLRVDVGLIGLVRKDVWDMLKVSEKEFLENKMDEQAKIEYDKFSHEAMYTTFEILISASDKKYASQAARAAFDEADKLNAVLSRFIENSDVSRINSAKAGQAVAVSPETIECLNGALCVNKETSGAFDITVGAVKDMFKDGKSPSQTELAAITKRVGMDKLQFNEEDFTVTKKEDGVSIDLGGIAKGYAVDKMAAVLVEWGIERALIHGGSSSVRALKGPADGQGWPVTISDPKNHTKILEELSLENQSFSSSGLAQGRHIIDPRTLKPVSHRSNVWVLTGDAMTGDAMATAMMVFSDDQLEKFTAAHPEVRVILSRPYKEN